MSIHQDSESVQLNYSILLLEHMRSISRLSATMASPIVLPNGQVLDVKDNDKWQAFSWAVKVLDAMIPSQLHDKAFEKELQRVRKEFQGEAQRGQADLATYATLIDLLARKGYLFEKYRRSRLTGDTE